MMADANKKKEENERQAAALEKAKADLEQHRVNADREIENKKAEAERDYANFMDRQKEAQKNLREYTRMLADMAGVEDLTKLEDVKEMDD